MPLSAETIRQAIEDPDKRREVRVSLTVSGGLPRGLPSQPSGLALRARGGTGMMEMEFTRTGLGGGEKHLALVDEERMMNLLQTLDGDELTGAGPDVMIPPDSLIGRLEVAIGGEVERIVFMADEAQAKAAKFELPPSATQFINQLVEIGRAADPGGMGAVLDPH